MLLTTSLLNDIEIIVNVLLYQQKNPNGDIIIYYGKAHISNIERMLKDFFKKKSMVSINSSNSGYVNIPSDILTSY